MKSLAKFIIGFLILLVIIGVYESKNGVIEVFNSKEHTSDVNLRGKYIENGMPQVVAQAALTLEVDNNKIIYAKNIHNRMYPASTTKLLTAQVFADSEPENGKIVYTKDAKAEPENKIGLKVGQILTADQAMNAMLIYSANDIAEAIGENVSQNINKFSDKMNEKASELGLKESHFVNANGLPNSNHYTTAYDLSIIAKNIYRYKWIMNVISKKTYDLKVGDRNINITNTNKLLDVNGCVAGKTGYTSEAGKCLVAYYERNNKRMIGIVLGSANDDSVDSDMEKIINWSYKQTDKNGL